MCHRDRVPRMSSLSQWFRSSSLLFRASARQAEHLPNERWFKKLIASSKSQLVRLLFTLMVAHPYFALTRVGFNVFFSVRVQMLSEADPTQDGF